MALINPFNSRYLLWTDLESNSGHLGLLVQRLQAREVQTSRPWVLPRQTRGASGSVCADVPDLSTFAFDHSQAPRLYYDLYFLLHKTEQATVTQVLPTLVKDWCDRTEILDNIISSIINNSVQILIK